MRVLILSVTAGGGHQAAADAISDELQTHDVNTVVLDIYKYINRFIYDAIDKGYALSTRYASDVYRIFYQFIENRHKRPTLVQYDPVSMVNTLLALRFERFTDNFEPDCIVCTHPLAAQIVNGLKARGKIAAPVIGIITDFTILPYWEDCTDIEYIVVANELLYYRAMKKGFAQERILPFGIPIKSKFAQSIHRPEARQQLGLLLDQPAVLLISGSMGHGDMAEMVREILANSLELQLVVVCGKNKRLFNQLVSMNGGSPKTERLMVFDYTDKVDLLMDAVDCIVTKPGGLTVSEALAKRLPMILVSPIPGQEERNTEFLLNIGAALHVTKTFSLDEAVFFLFNNPGRLRIMKESIDMISKPKSAKTLADFILGLSAAE
ncbi:MAG: hypothetical protein LBG68_00800 [Coriobacteriales bacterium]|jgi:processive 1,2-diacylglycerol beta-glucosyltransferase|nr:hypothetical protein [Coriobacteriales bacterium]